MHATHYVVKLFLCRIFYSRLYIITSGIRLNIFNRLINGIREKTFTRECSIIEILFSKQKAIAQMIYYVIRTFVTYLMFSIINIIKITEVGSCNNNINIDLIFGSLKLGVIIVKFGIVIFLKYRCCYKITFIALKKCGKHV